MMNHLSKKAQKLFIDTVRIKVRGGTGGHGLPQYGGIGGKGGDVYIRGSVKVKGLDSVFKSSNTGSFKAGDGRPSTRTRLVGDSGRDLILHVPLGVTIEDQDKQLVGEINTVKDSVIVAMGGRGGDKFNDSHGFVGQKRSLRLDLKLISDAVLVGFPNAGKSSLLRAISRATPKVANFPFTTLKPNIGVMEYDDYRRISVADLPGLVEGAHKNIGLGHEFLKHIVRAKLLVFLIDINHVDLGPSYARRSPLETLCILNKEIELYDDTILKKPAILAISKMDSRNDAEERYSTFVKDFEAFQKDPTLIEEYLRPSRTIQFDSIIPISSASKANIPRFREVIRDMLDKYAEAERLEKNMISSYRELKPLETNRIVQ